MSLGKQKNLIIIAAVGTALLAGTVLLGGYLPGTADTDEQVKACASGDAGVTCAAKTDAAAFPQVAATTDTAPAKPCCAAEKPEGACEKPATGCCEKPEAAAGCCDAKADAAAE